MASDDAVYDTRTFPGIRFFPGIGVRQSDTTWNGGASYVQDAWTEYGAPRENQWFMTTPRYWFIAEKKLEWKHVVVDETLAPTSDEQARDPNWANYRWNQTDVIGNMLTANAIATDRAKLSIMLAGTATSDPNPVPAWLASAGLSYVDSVDRTHVRMDLTAGWQAMANFYVAFIKRYGNDPRISSIILGEYYPGSGTPAGFSARLARTNVKSIWADVMANAPKDAYGDRMNIVQVNPIVSGGQVTSTDIKNAKIGVSGSDPYLFVNGCGESADPLCDAGTIDRMRQDVRDAVPMMHQIGATFFNAGETATWTGIANPFGFTNGQTVAMTLDHAVWYFGSKGVIPLNTITVRDNLILTEDWFPTFDRFGPNGTDAAAWGQLANYPS